MAKKASPAKPKGGGKKQAAKDKAKKAASASKGTKPVSAKKQPDASEQTRKVIGEQKLRALSKEVQQAMDQAASAGGVAGELISTAVKKDGLNAPAFRIAHRLKRLGDRDPAKLRILLDDFDYYRDALKLDDLAGESLFAPREGAQDQETDESGGPGEEISGDGVVNFPGNGKESRPAA